MPDDLRLDPADALVLAQRLIDTGQPFHAHEVLEAIWKSDAAIDRELWRGLAQLAVGLTHARRGNQRGAAALLRRGADAVGPSAAAHPELIEPAVIARAARDLADRIERAGLDRLSDTELRLQLAEATDTPALTSPPSAPPPP
jgi:uncharacterized protein